MFEPTLFYEHLSGKGICAEASDDNFTILLEDDVSVIEGVDRRFNLLSNKSSQIDFGFQTSRAQSASRKEFQFNRTNRCPSNSYLRQSINHGSSC
jgi:hypothetical protein